MLYESVFNAYESMFKCECFMTRSALRDEDRDQAGSYFPYLRMLFEACARLPIREVTLWRGVGVDLYEQYKVGSTITWWGVSSCTSDKAVAHNFANGCAGAFADQQRSCRALPNKARLPK
eukprot:g11780.t1